MPDNLDDATLENLRGAGMLLATLVRDGVPAEIVLDSEQAATSTLLVMFAKDRRYVVTVTTPDA